MLEAAVAGSVFVVVTIAVDVPDCVFIEVMTTTEVDSGIVGTLSGVNVFDDVENEIKVALDGPDVEKERGGPRGGNVNVGMPIWRARATALSRSCWNAGVADTVGER